LSGLGGAIAALLAKKEFLDFLTAVFLHKSNHKIEQLTKERDQLRRRVRKLEKAIK